MDSGYQTHHNRFHTCDSQANNYEAVLHDKALARVAGAKHQECREKNNNIWPFSFVRAFSERYRLVLILLQHLPVKRCASLHERTYCMNALLGGA